jgi:hypothetical protein
LANQLVERGFIVSMLIFKTDDVNSEMRATLNPGVSIYEADWVLEYGCEKFIDDIGCSLIHSHGVISENFFFQRCDSKLRIPYLATLHGSYEASTREELPESVLAKYVRQVDVFVYTAEKNLKAASPAQRAEAPARQDGQCHASRPHPIPQHESGNGDRRRRGRLHAGRSGHPGKRMVEARFAASRPFRSEILGARCIFAWWAKGMTGPPEAPACQ